MHYWRENWRRSIRQWGEHEVALAAMLYLIGGALAALSPDWASEPVAVRIFAGIGVLAAAHLLLLMFVMTPMRMHREAAASRSASSREAEVIAKLEEDTFRGASDRSETLAYWFAIELADDLSGGGITPDHYENTPFHGLYERDLNKLLGWLRQWSLVDVVRRTVERDKGYPYTVQDFYLSDLGAKVVEAIHDKWREEDD